MEAATVEILKGLGAVMAPVATIVVAWLGFRAKRYSDLRKQNSDWRRYEDAIVEMVRSDNGIDNLRTDTSRGTKTVIRREVRNFVDDNDLLR